MFTSLSICAPLEESVALVKLWIVGVFWQVNQAHLLIAPEKYSHAYDAETIYFKSKPEASYSFCAKEAEPDNIITMVTTGSKVSLEIFSMVTNPTTIDWGDGTVEEFFRVYNRSHSYAEPDSHTITITGEEIEDLSCRQNQLTSLDVSKNIALIDLECDNNQLTGLDVSKNTVLSDLHCGNNQLTAGGLNALFGTLHSDTGYRQRIWISDNPGTDGCNQSIATSKGWDVTDY